jgi:hypothetical protein
VVRVGSHDVRHMTSFDRVVRLGLALVGSRGGPDRSAECGHELAHCRATVAR